MESLGKPIASSFSVVSASLSLVGILHRLRDSLSTCVLFSIVGGGFIGLEARSLSSCEVCASGEDRAVASWAPRKCVWNQRKVNLSNRSSDSLQVYKTSLNNCSSFRQGVSQNGVERA